MIRHGQSTANASGVWQGQLEFSLSAQGRAQAELAGEALAGERIAGIYTSPLLRASETAEIIARKASFPEDIIAVPGLTERHGGRLQGTTPSDREGDLLELMQKLNSLPEEEGWALVGAETDEEVVTRFSEALASIRARHAAGDRILIVSHGGAMRAFLRSLFGPEILAGAQRAPNASITRIVWDVDESLRQSPQLLELASTEHLPASASPEPGRLQE